MLIKFLQTAHVVLYKQGFFFLPWLRMGLWGVSVSTIGPRAVRAERYRLGEKFIRFKLWNSVFVGAADFRGALEWA